MIENKSKSNLPFRARPVVFVKDRSSVAQSSMVILFSSGTAERRLNPFIGTPNSIRTSIILFLGVESKIALKSTSTAYSGLACVASAFSTLDIKILYTVSVEALSGSHIALLRWHLAF